MALQKRLLLLPAFLGALLFLSFSHRPQPPSQRRLLLEPGPEEDLPAFKHFLTPNAISHELKHSLAHLGRPLLKSSETVSDFSGLFEAHKRMVMVQERDHKLWRRKLLLGGVQVPLAGGVEISGLYYVQVYLGTPPQPLEVQVDTGSDLFWAQCAPCSNCSLTENAPPFRPSFSTSLTSPNCTTCQAVNQTSCPDAKGCIVGCSTRDIFNGFGVPGCNYVYLYGGGKLATYTSGLLREDNLIINGASLRNRTTATVLFGCSKNESSLSVTSQDTNGIMGLGQGPLSVPTQLANQKIIPNIFSLCLGGYSGGGYMVLGNLSTTRSLNMSYTPMGNDSTVYNVTLNDIRVNGTSLNLTSKAFANNSAFNGAVIDSGTTITYLPEAVYQAFVDQIKSRVKLPLLSPREIAVLTGEPAPAPQAGGASGTNRTLTGGVLWVCWIAPPDAQTVADVSAYFPDAEFQFANATMALRPINYLLLFATEGTRFAPAQAVPCLGVSSSAPVGNVTIIGDTTLRNHLVTYDRVNRQIGFAPANCNPQVAV